MKDCLELKEIREVKTSGDITVCEIVAYNGMDVITIPFKFRSIYGPQFQKLFNHMIPVKGPSRTGT